MGMGPMQLEICRKYTLHKYYDLALDNPALRRKIIFRMIKEVFELLYKIKFLLLLLRLILS